MPTIYEIADDLRALHDLLAETGGEVTPETEAAFASFEADMLANTSDKLDRYCSLIAELDARSASRKAEAKRIGDLARTDERVADSLRERLRWFFETHGIGKQETSRFRVALVANGGKAPLILDCSVDELPAWALSNKPTVNSEAIREALERGDIVPFAHLGERGKRVSIR